MSDHIAFQLVMDQLEYCGVGHINDLDMCRNEQTDILLEFDLIDKDFVPTRRGWRILASWWVVEPHWEEGLPPCVSPSCVAYFDNYAETASLLATGSFKLRQLKGDPSNV